MSTASSNKVLVLFGPTASGKTELLERLFLEVHRGLPKAEVVSADSMQVYRGMDLGTAKPDSVLRAALPHHLLDIRDPNEQYTAGDFVREADLACAEIRSRGRLPVVSGGTAFYIRNFVCGLPGSPAADPAVRAAVARDLAELGFAALRAELEAGDPVSAARIHPRDTYRLSRALEVMRRTGRPLSEHQVPDRPRPGLDPLFLALDRPRDELYSRIDARVKAMFSAGLAAEVSRLLARGYGEGDPGMQAIGYREFLEARRAGCSRMLDIQAAVARDSRRYARRQEAFFRCMPWVERRPAEDIEGISARIRLWWEVGR